MSPAKRIFDLVCVVPGLIIILPIWLIVAVLIWLEDRGPVIFTQERVGFRGVPFRMWKFRSMVVNAEKLGKQLTVGRDPRITRVGHFLRQSKLDELPQLVNVLRGEMSLVGPRPEVPRYVALYTADQRRVLEVPPGITDPASIRYRDESEVLAQSEDPERTYITEIMPDKIRLNLEYTANANVWADVRVIFGTLRRLFQ
jgi:lipopolysaccharide/colanic/teichoic acid biosynthesis glycosyltransferase